MRNFFKNNTLTGVIGFIFLAIMGTGAFGFVGQAMLKGWASASWPVSKGVVLSSEVKTHTSQNHPSYVPIVRYKYPVGDQWIQGSRLAFGFGNRSWEESSSIIERYSPGTPVLVFYNPDDPQESLLQPGVPKVNLLAVVFGVAAWVFAFLLKFSDALAQKRRLAKDS